MFCKNCGKEIADTAKFCDGCGQDFSKPTDKKGTINTLLNKVKQRKIILGGIVGFIILLIVGIIVISNLPSKPDSEQIKSDFVTKILNGEDFTITKMDTVSEENLSKNHYKTIANIIYNDGAIEYERQYAFSYYKEKTWLLESIDPLKENDWRKRPAFAPDFDEFKDKCHDSLNEVSKETPYDVFELVQDKTIVDLDNAEAQLIFNAKKSTALLEASGEIQFTLKFYFNTKEWVIIEHSHLDTYKKESKTLRSWEGTATQKSTGIQEKFILTIKNYNKSNYDYAELQFKNKTYQLKGNVSDSYFEYDVALDFSNKEENTNEKIRIYLNVKHEDASIASGVIYIGEPTEKDAAGNIMEFSDNNKYIIGEN